MIIRLTKEEKYLLFKDGEICVERKDPGFPGLPKPFLLHIEVQEPLEHQIRQDLSELEECIE